MDLLASILHKIYSMQRILIHMKKPIALLNMATCSQSMQRTWWPVASITIVTGSYCLTVSKVAAKDYNPGALNHTNT